MSEPAPHLPETFGPFVLLDHLAEGGMGTAYLAATEASRQLVVVKRLLPRLLDQQEAFRRFMHEAEVASHVRHAHVAELIAMGKVEGEPFLAVEYVFGVALSQVVDRVEAQQTSKIPVPILLRLALDLVSGLRGVHEACHRLTHEPLQLLHRDVGARNVLLGTDGRIQIIDLGLGRSRLSDWNTGLHRVSGSPDYMAPEQAVGESADARSDVYAAAATVWELAVGRKRIRGGALSERLERAATSVPVSIRPFRSDIPESLDQALMRAMVNDRQRRTESAAVLERELVAVTEQVEPASHDQVAQWLDRSFATSLLKSRRRIEAALSRLEDHRFADAGTGAEYFFGSERVREKAVSSSFFRPRQELSPWPPLALVGGTGVVLGLTAALIWTPSPLPRSEPVAPVTRETPGSPGLGGRPNESSDEGQPVASTSTAPAVADRADPREDPDASSPRALAPARELRQRKTQLARRLQRLRRLRYDVKFQRSLTEVGRAVSRARTPEHLDRLEARIRRWEIENE